MGKNGYFRLSTKEDGVFVEIIPPKEGGRVIDIGTIVNYFDKYGINEFDLKELNRAINDKEKASLIKVAKVGTVTNIDEEVEISVFQDKKSAMAKFYPKLNQGKELTLKDIISKLNEANVKAGVNQDVILDFLNNRDYGKEYELATAIQPVEGHDAEIKYFFNTNVNLVPKRNEDGTVDYKDLNTISHIEAGQKIAELIKEDPGKSGANVLGEEIKPHTVKSRKLEYGNNITASEDKTILYSNVTGHASLVNGKIFVSDVYEVPADIDNSIGNINYEGSVTVKGNVKGGFRVEAKGDIIVDGIVEDATLISGGQIIVKRGIHGMNKGLLQAESNVICKFIENAKVVSGGYIESEAILHSHVDAYSDIRVNGKKGFITGGEIRAGNTIEAIMIGSEMETVTKVEVGVDPIQKQRYTSIQQELKKNHEAMDKIKPVVMTYANKSKHGEVLAANQMVYIRQLVGQMKELQENIDALNLEMNSIGNLIAKANSARIKVSKTIYPGVTISISEAKMTLKDERNYSQFVRQDGEVKIIPL